MEWIIYEQDCCGLLRDRWEDEKTAGETKRMAYQKPSREWSANFLINLGWYRVFSGREVRLEISGTDPLTDGG